MRCHLRTAAEQCKALLENFNHQAGACAHYSTPVLPVLTLISNCPRDKPLGVHVKTEEDICREIANLHEYIIAAGVIQDRQLTARYSKVRDPPVTEERLKILFAQPEILISIARTNEDFFGGLRFVIICFESSDLVFFPADFSGTEKTLYIRMQRSFRGEEIVRKVYQYLEQITP